MSAYPHLAAGSRPAAADASVGCVAVFDPMSHVFREVRAPCVVESGDNVTHVHEGRCVAAGVVPPIAALTVVAVDAEPEPSRIGSAARLNHRA